MKFKAATLLGVDIAVLVIALGAFWLFAQTPPTFDVPNVVAALQQLLILGLCLIISFYYNNLYDLRVVRNFTDFCTHVPPALAVAFILWAVLVIIFQGLQPGMLSSVSLGSIVSLFLIVISAVFLMRAVCYSILRSRTFAERVLILGTSPLAQKIAEEIRGAPYTGYVIVGFVDDMNDPSRAMVSSSQYPVFGPLDRLEHIITELHPDRIIVALTERRGRLPVRDLLDARMKKGISVEDGIEVHERFTGKLAIESLNPSFLFFSKDFTISPFERVLRRIGSLAFSLVGLVLTAPLMVLIALAIKLDSKGSIFFIQERAGYQGKPFRLVKFRTMRPIESADNAEQSVWRRDSTARITKVGKILRKLRLDELPQFINILLGDMNLVGPRPEMVDNVKTMAEQIPYYSIRMQVRPGLTGWAQVRHGYSVSHEDVTEKMRYDLYYVKHMSVWFDIKIVIDTVKIVLLGQGSEQHIVNKSGEPVPTAELTGSTVSYLPSENSQERRPA